MKKGIAVMQFLIRLLLAAAVIAIAFLIARNVLIRSGVIK
jgi:hypothetical protein